MISSFPNGGVMLTIASKRHSPGQMYPHITWQADFMSLGDTTSQDFLTLLREKIRYREKQGLRAWLIYSDLPLHISIDQGRDVVEPPQMVTSVINAQGFEEFPSLALPRPKP